mmetsp:Transcript_496/g.1421  ORF Transcript_496/g.1421 Transcript_496/m.1421 type:complete len:416 (-) Transcript_496:91-1338(-)
MMQRVVSRTASSAPLKRVALGRLAHTSALSPPAAGVDFDSFSFGLNGVQTDSMWVSTFNAEHGEWDVGGLVPRGPLALDPASTAINYGQSIFEGLKAFRQVDGGVKIFRPDRNAARMREGSARFLLPDLPEELFLHACDAVVAANARWVPPHKRGTLYLRPLLLGSGAALGVGPSPVTTFCVYASPVGNYFKGGVGEAPPISLQVAGQYRRAMRGGAGRTKAAGNYAPCFAASKEAKGAGFSETLFLDAAQGTFIEEAGASNFFAVVPAASGGLELVTPPVEAGTILPGVTRASVLALARAELGHLLTAGVAERPLALEEIEHATEVFCTGTGASISSVGSVTAPLGEDGCSAMYEMNGWGEVTKAVANKLFAIQWGDCADEHQWMREVCAPEDVALRLSGLQHVASSAAAAQRA